ncbi:hypothetical protein M3Y94_00625900 [Aphelenchoides besseyi]|nr:hypothetical protein M3Y94_00625900 [Aphelenchoides besseyi]KAI6218969.1 hypothetical protein M3Y95_01144700 [Aphelenchoides besseyi]
MEELNFVDRNMDSDSSDAVSIPTSLIESLKSTSDYSTAHSFSSNSVDASDVKEDWSSTDFTSSDPTQSSDEEHDVTFSDSFDSLANLISAVTSYASIRTDRLSDSSVSARSYHTSEVISHFSDYEDYSTIDDDCETAIEFEENVAE